MSKIKIKDFMRCYDKDGPYCKYCFPCKTTNDPSFNVHGLPRYKCIHPIEFDNPIDADIECTCPKSYIREDRKCE